MVTRFPVWFDAACSWECVWLSPEALIFSGHSGCCDPGRAWEQFSWGKPDFSFNVTTSLSTVLICIPWLIVPQWLHGLKWLNIACLCVSEFYKEQGDIRTYQINVREKTKLHYYFWKNRKCWYVYAYVCMYVCIQCACVYVYACMYECQNSMLSIFLYHCSLYSREGLSLNLGLTASGWLIGQ